MPVEFIPPRAGAHHGDEARAAQGLAAARSPGDLRVPRVVIRHELPGNGARLVFDIAPPTPHTVVAGAGAADRALRGRGRRRRDAAGVRLAKDGCRRCALAESAPSIVIELGPRFAQLPRRGHTRGPGGVAPGDGRVRGSRPTPAPAPAAAAPPPEACADAAADDRRACAPS